MGLLILLSRTIEGPELQSVVHVPVLRAEFLRERLFAVVEQSARENLEEILFGKRLKVSDAFESISVSSIGPLMFLQGLDVSLLNEVLESWGKV